MVTLRCNLNCGYCNVAKLLHRKGGEWGESEADLEKINQVFPVHMSIVLLRSEVERGQDKLLKTARFIHDAGCRSLRFWIYRSTGAEPRPEEIINDSSPVYIEFCKRMEDTLPGFCLWLATVQTGEVKKNCPQLWQLIMGDMLGNIIPCCGILDTTLKGPNSNLFNSDLDVLLNHPMLVTMREQLLNPECDPPGVCKTCNLLGESGW